MWRAAAMVLIGLPLAMAAGCPPRELTIDITEEGLNFITGACDTAPCSASEPADNRCCAPSPRPNFDEAPIEIALQLALIERDGDSRILRASTACMKAGLSCFNIPDDAGTTRCLALEARDLLDTALREEGLSYDGMDPERTDVIMVIYASPLGGEPVECVTDQVFACAGLASSTEDPKVYRIVCAACGDNNAVPPGRFDVEAVPCFGACFTESCRDLFANGIITGT